MFKTRLISGIILVLIALLTIISGGWVLIGTLGAVSVIGMSELYRIKNIHLTPPAVLMYTGTAAYYILLAFDRTEFLWPCVLAVLILLLAVYVFTFPAYKADQIMMLYFGFFYVAVMMSFIYRTRVLEDGSWIVWLVFLASWGCDTLAYCTGMLTRRRPGGNHQMSPVLSPKKSVEGAVGGVAGAALLGALYALCANRFGGARLDAAVCAVICGAGGAISMVGDLAASAVKRDFGIKDYGTLIPGHGGILDRFDSVIFTAPIIYYLAVYVGR